MKFYVWDELNSSREHAATVDAATSWLAAIGYAEEDADGHIDGIYDKREGGGVTYREWWRRHALAWERRERAIWWLAGAALVTGLSMGIMLGHDWTGAPVVLLVTVPAGLLASYIARRVRFGGEE